MKITIEEVAKQLSENVSIEFQDENTATYFLHLDEDGHLESFGNVVFHTDRDVSGMTKEEIYDTETLDNPDFKAICEDLAEQANEWMSENQ